MPAPVVSEHLDMIGVLQAEESLRRVTETAAGNGLMPDHDRQRILAGWRRDARRGQLSRRQTLSDLLAPGLGLTVVKKGERLPEWRRG